jgi:alpha-amylase
LAALVACIALAACSSGSSTGDPVAPVTPVTPTPELGQDYRPSGHTAAGDVFVHLFEWRWPDVARECEVWLGPKGYKAVQISPPSEHALITTGGAFYPWWQRYQTVSYKLDRSRSGTAAELNDMVGRCRAVGVELYADVVINHMTAGSGVGSAGSSYTKYAYPAVPYTSNDFHSPCSIDSYAVVFQVQNCELVGLADLRTEDATVRETIAQYLISLNALGIAGFRIDAAKHVAPRDLDAILSRVNGAAAAAGRARPYVFMEVINNAGDAVTPSQYYGVGFASGGASELTDFQYGYRLTDAFSGRNGGTVNGAALQSPGALPSDKSVVFVDNHDNQRGDNLYYASAGYELAVLFMLAHPHGYPSVMSSFGFDHSAQSGRDAGPPSAGVGVTASTFAGDGTSRCTITLGLAQVGEWICEHRRLAIANMVAFRRAAAGTPISACGRTSNTIGDDPNRVALCRDGAGFIAINRTATEVTASLPTKLAAGSYCNVARFEFVAAAGTKAATCGGAAVLVNASGDATITIAAMGAVALHRSAKLN